MNIGVLDADPGLKSHLEADANEHSQANDKALARLRALAQRAPEVFSVEVVGQAVQLVKERLVPPALLDTLRLIASARPEFGRQVVEAGLAVLQEFGLGPGSSLCRRPRIKWCRPRTSMRTSADP